MQSARFPVGQQGLPAHESVSLSSTTPLQSLSIPSQISGLGPLDPEQSFAPLVHTTTPGLHWPMQLASIPPGQAEPQAPPTSVSLDGSSTIPLQSSSSPLQVSGIGPTVCRQVRPLGPGPGVAAHTQLAAHWPAVLTFGSVH